jgi:hypothetical protein
MARILLATALLASRAAALAMPAHVPLQLNWCDATEPLQQFVVSGSTVTDATGALCATMSAPYPAALTMEPCSGAATQAWTFNKSTQWPAAFASPSLWENGCAIWNTQGGPGYELVGSTVGVYACSSPTPFDSVFKVGYPFAGAIAATMTEPGNTTFSNLCVQATVPPPPPIGTPDIIAWQETEMACFYHWNMATAKGSQGCGGCSQAPPDISIWNPTALDTDSWAAAGVAMGCKRLIYVAKHGCGFATWPSNATILGERYPYSVAYAPNTTDVVAAFVASAQKLSVGYGFYYSVGSNAKCNVQGGNVCGNPVAGQLNVTKADFDDLVIQQLTELWSIGPLAEVWCVCRAAARRARVRRERPLNLSLSLSPPPPPLGLTADTRPTRRRASRISLRRSSRTSSPLAPRGSARVRRGGWGRSRATRLTPVGRRRRA